MYTVSARNMLDQIPAWLCLQPRTPENILFFTCASSRHT